MAEHLRVYGPAFLAWVAAVYKVRALLQNPRNPIIRSFWASIFLMALSLTALLPPAYAAIGQLSGVPSLARLLSNALSLVCCWTAQMFLLYVLHPPERARQSIFRLAALLIVTVLLMVA